MVLELSRMHGFSTINFGKNGITVIVKVIPKSADG
jgi:hypothetical protein